MRICYDTEFLEAGHVETSERSVHLISIGLEDVETGDTYYAVNAWAPQEHIKHHPWLSKNVWPYLPRKRIASVGTDWLNDEHPDVKDPSTIAEEVLDFVRYHTVDEEVELWAYYSAYDHVALCSLFGNMINLPSEIPKWTHDIMQRWELYGNHAALRPPDPTQEHYALADAKWDAAFMRNMDVIMKQWSAMPTHFLDE